MSIQVGTVVINRNPVFGTRYWIIRLNQTTIYTADGGRVTYDNGPEILKGIIILKSVAKSEGDSLRTYITDTAIYGKNSFTIDPPTATDLGLGDNVNITTAYFDGGTNIKGIFTYKAPGKYDIEFPYWKLLP